MQMHLARAHLSSIEFEYPARASACLRCPLNFFLCVMHLQNFRTKFSRTQFDVCVRVFAIIFACWKYDIHLYSWNETKKNGNQNNFIFHENQFYPSHSSSVLWNIVLVSNLSLFFRASKFQWMPLIHMKSYFCIKPIFFIIAMLRRHLLPTPTPLPSSHYMAESAISFCVRSNYSANRSFDGTFSIFD